MARNLFLAWTLSLLCLQTMAQTSSQNYIVEKDNIGYLTGTISLTTDGELLVAAYYQRIDGLLVESRETLPDGALLSQTTTYSYTKKPATVTTTVTRGNVTKTVVQTNTYNQHNDQIESVALEMDGVKKTIASYTYDDLGRQTRVQRGGSAGTVINEYNVRGWLTSTTSPKFQQTLSYEQGGAEPCYNGNQIKAISDKAGSLLYDGSFDFKDGANEATEYFYDANGALAKDLNKGIGNIEYDVQGNPLCVTFANGNKMKYVYDADGSKLRTTHESVVTNTTDYAGNFVFEDGKLDKYLFEGGYCSFDANLLPTYHYYEKDHLGSVRMVVNENGTIEQVNHYYPFGGVYGDLSYNSELQRNKYIGKELDHTDGLDWYDHGARMYDAAKVSWDRVEKKNEKYYNWTLYSYCINNPIKFYDVDGYEPGDFFKSADAAALDFAMFYNDNSIRSNREYASSIYAVINDNGEKGFTYTLPNIGQEDHCYPSLPSVGNFLVAIVHTHGSSTSSDGNSYRNNEFSGSTFERNGKFLPIRDLKKVNRRGTDISQANYLKVDSYLATPNGSLLKYDYKLGQTSVVNTKIPSDSNDKSRVNNVSTQEKHEIDAMSLRRIIDKLLRLNMNSYISFR